MTARVLGLAGQLCSGNRTPSSATKVSPVKGGDATGGPGGMIVGAHAPSAVMSRISIASMSPVLARRIDSAHDARADAPQKPIHERRRDGSMTREMVDYPASLAIIRSLAGQRAQGIVLRLSADL